MKNDTDIVALRHPESVDDGLTEIAREGARRMLAAALRAEANAFIAQHAEEVLPDGRRRVVRHGHGPMRSIQTGIGALDVRRPKVRDRAVGPDEEKIRFTSAILPKWARRVGKPRCAASRALSARHIHGRLSGGAGRDPGEERAEFVAKRDLAADRPVAARIRPLATPRPLSPAIVYIWADGVYLQARMEPQAECMLVVLGATPEGRKELVGFQVGVRESAQSWRELLVDLKARGLEVPPEIAVGPSRQICVANRLPGSGRGHGVLEGA